MKTKIKKEIQTKTIEELKQAIQEAEKVLFSFRMDKAKHALTNTRSIFMKRKELAVLKTVLHMKKEEKK